MRVELFIKKKPYNHKNWLWGKLLSTEYVKSVLVLLKECVKNVPDEQLQEDWLVTVSVIWKIFQEVIYE